MALVLPTWVYIVVPAVGFGAAVLALFAAVRGGQHEEFLENFTGCPHCGDPTGIRCCEFGRDQ